MIVLRGALTEPELVIMRVFNAPRDIVWKAWTDPEQALRWWGPSDYPATEVEMDVRPGGVWRGQLRSVEDGRVLTHRGVFREVEPGVRIVQTERYDPGTVGGEYPGAEALITLSFADDDGMTTVTTLMDFGSKEGRDAAMSTGMTNGMEQSYALLDKKLAEETKSAAAK